MNGLSIRGYNCDSEYGLALLPYRIVLLRLYYNNYMIYSNIIEGTTQE